jgi:hypothetical protein
VLDPIESNVSSHDLKKLTVRLARANRFNLDALDANRGGKLTTQQKVKFLAFFAALTIAGLCVAILLVVSFYLVADSLEGAWWLIPIVLVIVVLALLILRRQFGTVRDYLQGEVVAIRGVVSKGEILSQGYEGDEAMTPTSDITYYYKVKKHRFTVNEAGYTALQERMNYCFYFLPRSLKLVNIEALDYQDSS